MTVRGCCANVCKEDIILTNVSSGYVQECSDMSEKKEKPRIIIDTQVLLDLTGWSIDELMQILQVPPQHRQRIIDAITISE